MIRIKWIATALALTLLALPGAALAQGGAAGDQYTEQVPNAAGGNGSGGGGDLDGSAAGTGSGSGSGGGNGAPLGSATVDRFNKGGADGNAAADLAGKTAPDSAALNDSAAQAQAGSTADTGSVFGASGDSAGSDDGMGIWLPIILALVLLGGLGYAWKRRRDDSSGTPGGRTASTGSLRDRFRSILPGRS